MVMTVEPVRNTTKAADYYGQEDDYYKEQNQATSAFKGALCKDLGIQPGSEVDAKQFKKLLAGHAPGKKPPENHAPGWDATFSAPKGVSVAALIGGDKRILDAHNKAVNKAMQKLEALTSTRIKQNGEIKHENTGKFAAATFKHEVNRNQEAQLHTHAVIFNLTKTADGKYRSLTSREFYKAQNAMTHAYHAELGKELQKLGYKTERVQGTNCYTTDISGVPNKLKELHTTRREDIKKSLQERGIDIKDATGKERQISTLNTRKKKENVDHGALKADWRAQAEAAGLTKSLDNVIQSSKNNMASNEPEVDFTKKAEESLNLSINAITERNAQFTKKELQDELYKQAVGNGAGINNLDKVLKNAERNGLIFAKGGGFYTTFKAQQQERTTLASVKHMQNRFEPLQNNQNNIKKEIQKTEKETGFTFNKGQRAATFGLFKNTDGVCALQGYAGTAKTTSVLKTIARAEQEKGKTVFGLAPTHSAKDSLKEGAETKNADTVQGYLAKQAKTKEEREGRTLIVDEASMLSAKDMRKLVKNAEKNGDKLILVGDVKQLGSVEAGRAFEQMQQSGMQTYKLDEILRQKNEDLKSGVKESIENNADNAIKNIEKSGQIQEKDKPEDRREQIAADYTALSPQEQSKSIVIDPSREGRDKLNNAIRDRLQAKGEVGKENVTVKTIQKKDITNTEKQHLNGYNKGDKVSFNRNYKKSDLEKGKEYTVTGKDDINCKVKLQDKAGNNFEMQPSRMAAHNINIYNDGKMQLSKGDKIRFTANNKDDNIKNGDNAQVKSINTQNNTAQIKMDNGKNKELDLNKMQNMQYGYAQTAHAAQGKTKDRVFMHAESGRENLINSKSFYVSISRAKEAVNLYTDDKQKLTSAINARAGHKSAALDEHTKSEEKQEVKTNAKQTANKQKTNKKQTEDKQEKNKKQETRGLKRDSFTSEKEQKQEQKSARRVRRR